MADRVKIKNMAYHKKALTNREYGLIASDEQIISSALDALTSDKAHPGLVLGAFMGKELRALLVFENIQAGNERTLRLKECREAETGFCAGLEKDIVQQLSEYLMGCDASGAEYGTLRLYKEKTNSRTAWAFPIAMAASFSMIYMNIFESKIAGALFGIGIGLSIGMSLYRNFTVKVKKTREVDKDAASE